MPVNLGVLAASLSILWVLFEGLAAYCDGMLTPKQMLQKHPQHLQGLPFLCHGGMWGDLFIITPVVGVIVALYSGQWSLMQILVMLGIGIALSIAMHCVYIMTPFPDSLAWKGGGISAAGGMHVLYMGVASAIIGLLYFCTANVPPSLLVSVSVLLVVHVAVGNHLVLGWLDLTHRWSWCPDFIRKPDPWITTAATCFIFAVMTAWASSSAAAGFAVMGVCIFISALVYLWVTNTPSTGGRLGM